MGRVGGTEIVLTKEGNGLKQYCRYCANAYLQGDDFIWCEPKNKMRDKKNCITPNHCKHFLFNELDVFDIDKKYEPRKAYKRKDVQQIEAGQIIISLTK